MFWEKKLEDWAAGIRNGAALPLRLELWDGRRFDFDTRAPQVTISVPQPSAVPYLLSPSLFNLGRAYVEGEIDIEGDVEQMIRIAGSLAASARSGVRSETNDDAAAWRSDSAEATPLQKFARVGRDLGRRLSRGIMAPREHSREADAQAIHYHYDVSNEFYAHWLDPQMVYSCAYFENGDEDLATAQLRKIDHILTKLQVRPGQTLLDIGCGWGALVLRAAEKFHLRCVGVTVSENQYDLARQRVAQAGLSAQVEIRREDYRDLRGRFDRITSVGMFEHVGLTNLPTYFAKIRSLLGEDGIAMNHGITTTDIEQRGAAYGASEFIARYVFPKGELAHLGTVLRAMQQAGLETLDVENLRRHYRRTCTLWSASFDAHAAQIRSLIDEKRYRIWRIYLAGCAYGFEKDWVSLYQVLCTRAGSSGSSIPWSRRYMYS